MYKGSLFFWKFIEHAATDSLCRRTVKKSSELANLYHQYPVSCLKLLRSLPSKNEDGVKLGEQFYFVFNTMSSDVHKILISTSYNIFLLANFEEIVKLT